MNNFQRDPSDNQYPLDVTALKKGDYLDPEFCAERVKCRAFGTNEYNMALMKLHGQLVHLCEKKGLKLVLRIRKNGIRVLTDNEAVPTIMKEIDGHVTKIVRRHREQVHKIDIAELSSEMRPQYERNQVKGAFLVAGIRRARKEARKQLAPARTERPKLLPKKAP